MKEIFVGAVFLGGEVIPNEALDGLVERADRLLARRIRHDRTKDLEAIHEVALAFLDVAALDRKPKQAVTIHIFRVDAERHGIDAAHRVDLVTADLF